MESLTSAMYIILASLVLVQAVKLFIKSSSKIAKHLGVSEYTISFLIVAIATSLPEMIVGITSAVEGNPNLSFGNAIGSNIALLTLVISLPVFFSIKGISTRSILNSRDAYYSVFFGLLPIALIIDGRLNRNDAIILLLAYVFYSVSVWRRSTQVEKILEQLEKTNLWKQSVVFLGSLALLLGSSNVIVHFAQILSIDLGWGLTFVGLTITAVGTSLPEIAFTLGAARGRYQQEILGNIVGSIVANSTLVLGLTAIIAPIEIKNGEISYTSLASLVLTLLVFLGFIRTREKIDKVEAVILLALYIAFVAVEYYLQQSGIQFPLFN